jgi:hypothetical protein
MTHGYWIRPLRQPSSKIAWDFFFVIFFLKPMSNSTRLLDNSDFNCLQEIFNYYMGFSTITWDFQLCT